MKKGPGQGVTTGTTVGSSVELPGAVVVGGVQKTAKVVLLVDSRDAVDFFDPDKSYTVTFTEDV